MVRQVGHCCLCGVESCYSRCAALLWQPIRARRGQRLLPQSACMPWGLRRPKSVLADPPTGLGRASICRKERAFVLHKLIQERARQRRYYFCYVRGGTSCSGCYRRKLPIALLRFWP